MANFNLNINGKSQRVDVDPAMPLLWVLRDVLGLTGTKYGCGIAQCGSCTVHLDGEAARSCITTVSAVGARKVTTIEGLSTNRSHPVQQAWIEEEVPQCGYCQVGMIMSASALLAKKSKPTDADINTALSGHICRCGTYQRIRRAIHRAAGKPRPTPRSGPSRPSDGVETRPAATRSEVKSHGLQARATGRAAKGGAA